MTHEYILELVSSVTYNEIRGPTLPKRLALLLANVSQKIMYWPTICPDEVERRFMDDVETPGDWDVFDVVPDEIETHALKYLRQYRSA